MDRNNDGDKLTNEHSATLTSADGADAPDSGDASNDSLSVEVTKFQSAKCCQTKQVSVLPYQLNCVLSYLYLSAMM